jgi:hypothetical protein
LVATGKDTVTEVVKLMPTGFAAIALMLNLGVIFAALNDLVGMAVSTANAIGPAMLTDQLVAFAIVDEVGECSHRCSQSLFTVYDEA